MNREEVVKCLGMLKVNYQSFSRNMSARDAESLIDLWLMSFADEPYLIVSLAIADLMKTKKDFAPDIAAITERIRDMKAAAIGEPTNDELWLMLKRAASNSTYNSEKEFAKLPPILQQYVGSPGELRSMAMVDADTFETVNRGLFYKNIEITKNRAEFHERMSPEVRELLGGVANSMRIGGAERATLQPAQRQESRRATAAIPASFADFISTVKAEEKPVQKQEPEAETIEPEIPEQTPEEVARRKAQIFAQLASIGG